MAIRITALVKRRPGMTREEFREHWSNNHARLFTSLKVMQENIFHLLSPSSDALEKAGFNIAPYDGAAELWVEKLEDLLAVFGDEDYHKIVVPDEVNFLDRDSIQIMVGEDQVKYEKA
ncbi:hypothetical protein NM688_g888 [Phlebia brevispora]|uniref:Uncharacterized protein n=1 Tax=Phlebia brevispora TaxID=194682 RepID=A0ACC1TCX5_9APHY|nr:hypothetical protein NM688_g888 [Phlebia brevispora]